MTYPQPKDCPKCNGKSLVKRGIDKNKQRYECKYCLHKFRYNGVIK